MSEIELAAIREFVKRVEARAEETMSKPPYKLEGAHYNAMKIELALLESSEIK